MEPASTPVSGRISAEWIMAFASVMATGANVSVKFFTVPLVEMAQSRYIVQWMFSFSALVARSYISSTPLRLFGPAGPQRRWLVVRALAYFAFVWCWWSALRLVPLGDASVVMKLAAFMIGFADWVAFGTKLTAHWLASCAVALVGVVLVVRPPILFGADAPEQAADVASRSLGFVLNVLAAAAGALMSISVKFAPDAHFMEVQHVADLLFAFVLCPPLVLGLGSPAELASPAVAQAGCVTACFGFGALCLFTLSFQRGSAGRVALVNYIEVPIAYAAQVFLFGTEMHWTAVLGSALIIGSAVAAAWT